jgi:AbrB family looped-hinge helix DNA binding protein
MRITDKGQVTIPQAIREQAGFMPGTEVFFDLVGAEVRLRKAEAPASRPTRGQKLIQALRATRVYPMSTDEIIALMRGESAEEEMDRSAP